MCAPSKGRKSGNGWDGEKGREREKERRLETKGQRKRQGRELHGERQNELDGARRKHRKRTKKKEKESEISRTHARENAHSSGGVSSAKRNARSKQKRRNSLKLTCFSLLQCCFSFLRAFTEAISKSKITSGRSGLLRKFKLPESTRCTRSMEPLSFAYREGQRSWRMLKLTNSRDTIVDILRLSLSLPHPPGIYDFILSCRVVPEASI